MTRSLLVLLGSQVVLEATLVALFVAVPGGRAVLGLAPVLGLFGGAFVTGRVRLDPERVLLRRLALVSGGVHALVGAVVAASLGEAWFIPLLLGGTAWVLTIAGLDFGAFTGHSRRQ